MANKSNELDNLNKVDERIDWIFNDAAYKAPEILAGCLIHNLENLQRLVRSMVKEIEDESFSPRGVITVIVNLVGVDQKVYVRKWE